MTTSSRPVSELAFEYLKEVFQPDLDQLKLLHLLSAVGTLLLHVHLWSSVGTSRPARRYEHPIKDVATELRHILNGKRPQNRRVYYDMRNSISMYCRNRALISTRVWTQSALPLSQLKSETRSPSFWDAQIWSFSDQTHLEDENTGGLLLHSWSQLGRSTARPAALRTLDCFERTSRECHRAGDSNIA